MTTPGDTKQAIKHKCGHKVGVRQLESQDCPGCVGRSRNKAKRRYEKGRKAREPGWRQKAVASLPRLPDGSTFFCLYDAQSGTWQGSLNVIVETSADGFPVRREFHDRDPGLYALQAALDAQWRSWLAERHGDKGE